MLNRYAPFISALIVSMVFGIAAHKYQFFPAPQLIYVVKQARLALGVFSSADKWYYRDADGRPLVKHYPQAQPQAGLTMLTGIGADDGLFVRIIDSDGEVVHQWDIDWYQLWPDATHIPEHLIPQGRPGTHLHGSRLMDNGDIVFNFENLGLMRLDVCSNVVWKLAYPTHHSVFADQSGNLWLPGQVYHQQPLAHYPNYQVPFKEDTVVIVSPDGQLLKEYSIMDILKTNGYEGLMYMSTTSSRNPKVTGDVYHLNDVEVFPSTMKEGVFKQGDVLVSLRNINTVLVFDPQTLNIRFIRVGQFVRQHDADFVDGNTISLYDNNHIGPESFGQSSKILLISALTGEVSSYLSSPQPIHFYSDIMGKHQWLDNGNLLVLESRNGRVIEISRQKTKVWEYNNLIADTNMVGIMEGAERLPARFDQRFFADKLRQCQR